MKIEFSGTIEEYLQEVMSLHVREFLPLHFETDPVIPARLIEKLRSGEGVADRAFDRVFPERLRMISFIQWSPIEVALTIAMWLKEDRPGARFVDMGSGVGKLCLLLAIVSDLRVTGVEQREYLVEIAKAITARNSLNARFEHMNCLDVNWQDFDIFYFYNPFQEHVVSGEFLLIDDKVDLNYAFHSEYTKHVNHQLHEMVPGKRLITFHGYGGLVPGNLKLLRSKRIGNGKLCMWEKASYAMSQAAEGPAKIDPTSASKKDV